LPQSYRWAIGIWSFLPLLLLLTASCSNCIRARATILIKTVPPPVAPTKIQIMDQKLLEAVTNRAESAFNNAERATKKAELAARKAESSAKKAEEASEKAKSAANKIERAFLLLIKK
jgi:hypothetical protein